MKLAGKKALITGGNSGIGLATALRFIKEGAHVAITGRNQETLDAAIAQLGPNAVGFQGDVTDAKSRKAIIDQIAEKFGKLDILFANAGIAGRTPAGSAPEELFGQIININLTSVFFTVQDALPLLNDGASVIFNGSVIGSLGTVGNAAYAASKAGVRALSRSLAADLSPRGIRVNVVSPGAIKTAIWGRHTRRSPEEAGELAARMASFIPLGRWGEADEIAKAVLFLASDDSSYVQAAELFVDGGLTGTPFGGPAGLK
jgi:NAD(P)-dependent dehydrogenase (short-subunit alcohol dehydrogenase family)